MNPEREERLTLRASDDVVARTIAGEHLLVPVRNGTASMDCIYTANEAGSLIFRLLDGRRDEAAIARIVHREFEIPMEQALADVREFLRCLCEAGLAVAASEEVEP